MRRRLVLVALATTTMVAVAFVVPLGMLVRSFARDRALNAGEREARALAPVLAVVDDPDRLVGAVESTEAGRQGHLTVFLPDGSVLGTSAPEDENVALARQGRAFSARSEGGVDVLAPVAIPSEGVAVVRVFVPDADLEHGVARSWTILGLLAALLVALAVAVADRLGRAITAPISALSAAAARVGEGELEVRVEPEGPVEVSALAGVFNRMVGRIRGLLTAERESVADLSHRLRTPLTALRLDAEALSDPDEAGRLLDDVTSMERAVTSLIEEARQPARRAAGLTCDLGVVAAERAAFWGALAEDQDRPYVVDIAPGEHPVALEASELEAALDVLLGNVFAHTPDGTRFSVRVSGDDEGGSVLVVEDEGPGLASEAVLERGVSTGDSTGLGLDIARRAAEAAGGRLRCENLPAGGARVVLWFPASEP